MSRTTPTPPLWDARSFEACLQDNGIVRVAWKDVDIELPDAVESTTAISSLSSGMPRPTLVELRGLRSMTRACREYFSGPKTAAVVAAAGVVVASPLARAMGMFFLGINKPLMPTRLFKRAEDAEVWLRDFVV